MQVRNQPDRFSQSPKGLPKTDIFKMAALIFLPLFLIVGAFIGYYILLQNKTDKVKIQQIQKINADAKNKFVLYDIRKVIYDLCFLTEETARHLVIEPDGTVNTKEKQELILVFKNFSQYERFYHQVRFIGIAGREIIRINNGGSGAAVVPEDQLQDKSERYYVSEGLKLADGGIYISKFDLNIEQEKLEVPLRPMLRFCKPVFNDKGQKLGLVVLNYNGSRILEDLSGFGSETDITQIMLNPQGHWLTGGDSEGNFAFMYKGKEGITFEDKYKKEWQEISQSPEGQFETENGLFTFTTIQLESGIIVRSILENNEDIKQVYSKDAYWKIISYYPREKLYAAQHERIKLLGFAFAIISTILFLISWILAKTQLTKKLVQKKLAASEKEFRDLANNIPGVIYRCKFDKDWTMLFISDAVLDLAGYAPSEFINNSVRTFASLIHPDDRQHVEDIINQAVASGEPYNIEYRIIGSDNEVHWAYEKGQAVASAEDELKTELQGAIFDLTEKKKTEQELEKARQDAEAANKAKSQFLANMSHEIRTPMNAIMGISQMMSQYKNEGLDPTQKEGIEIIYRSGKRLLGLINNILDLSKIEAGKMEVKLASCSVDEIIKDIKPLAESLVKDKEIIITVEKRDSVPETVVSDKQKLHQVLMNLLGNAIKFTEKGRIDVDTWYDDGKLHFAVKDTGIGIDKDKLPDIFDNFVQLDMKYQGTGLGLPISKKMVEMLGGKIEAESEPGRGTTIKFYVVAEALNSQQNSRHDAKATIDNAQRPDDDSRPFILIAEDNPDSRTTLKMMLSEDYNLVMAADGAEALEKLRQSPAHLVLTDIAMPNVDGYELLKKIREEDSNRNIAVIALTASVMEEDKEKIRKAGFDDFIPKPVDVGRLKEIIDKYTAFRNSPQNT